MISKDPNEKLEFTLKHNYMFLALMNTDETSLRLLIAATLNLKLDDIKSVKINNPIVIGEKIKDKTFILDVKVTLNDNTILDIELQVEDYHNWPERSLGYACRCFDQLNKGDDYIYSKPVINISILDFTLFPKYPEFYSEYILLNTKNYNIYTSKFKFYVLDLTKEELATREDISSGRVAWAKLFKAKTWGDFMKVLEEYNEFESTVDSIETLSDNDDVISMCRTLEDEKQDMKYYMSLQASKIQELSSSLAEKEADLAEKDEIIKELRKQLESK